MARNDLLTDGQSQTRTRHLACRSLHPIEFFKDVGERFDRNAHAGIMNGETPITSLQFYENRRPPPEENPLGFYIPE